MLPAYTSMLVNRGRYLALFNRHERAIFAFKEALALNPRLAAAQQGLAESTANCRADNNSSRPHILIVSRENSQRRPRRL